MAEPAAVSDSSDTHDERAALTLAGGSAPIRARASMAMSDTGSSFAQWAALYRHHHDALPDAAATADVGVGIGGTTAAAASPTSGVSSGGGGGSPTKAGKQQVLHGVEGPRIGKPVSASARRRSRASRRAPVTLLNTDTANFRAMVQQFTGIPAPPAGAFGVGSPVINFAADYGFPPASSSAVMPFDHQLRGRSQHAAPAPLLQEQLRRQQQYTGASSQFGGYGNGLLQLQGGGDVFASHGGFAASAEDRMLLQSFQAAQMPHMPPVSAAANTATNGFFA